MDSVFKRLESEGFFLVDWRSVGSGGFGRAYRMRWDKYEGSEFIAKIIVNKNRGSRESFERELSVIKQLSHKNIVNLFCSFDFGDSFVLIEEFCPNGSLQEFIMKNREEVNEREFVQIALQCAESIEKCHNSGIVHRDIKPSNFLFDKHWRVKLIDFGISMNVERGSKIKEFNGSRPFFPPEIVNRRAHDPYAADIWALGVTFYNLLNGFLPFKRSLISIEEQICHMPAMFDYGVSDEINRLIASMIFKDPTFRPSVSQVVRKLRDINDSIPISLSFKLSHSKNLNQIKASNNKKETHIMKASSFRHNGIQTIKHRINRAPSSTYLNKQTFMM